jgi:hypothetical protein
VERGLKQRLENENQPRIFFNNEEPQSIDWIEALLQTPISDYRKQAMNLILAPYLLNISRLSEDEAYGVIHKWLEKCEQPRRFDKKDIFSRTRSTMIR